MHREWFFYSHIHQGVIDHSLMLQHKKSILYEIERRNALIAKFSCKRVIVYLAGADPGFSWGGGGRSQKIMCAQSHHKPEARSPLRQGSLMTTVYQLNPPLQLQSLVDITLPTLFWMKEIERWMTFIATLSCRTQSHCPGSAYGVRMTTDDHRRRVSGIVLHTSFHPYNYKDPANSIYGRPWRSGKLHGSF